eukprot:g73801.t1
MEHSPAFAMVKRLANLRMVDEIVQQGSNRPTSPTPSPAPPKFCRPLPRESLSDKELASLDAAPSRESSRKSLPPLEADPRSPANYIAVKKNRGDLMGASADDSELMIEVCARRTTASRSVSAPEGAVRSLAARAVQSPTTPTKLSQLSGSIFLFDENFDEDKHFELSLH